jgi:lambda family phage minor tail protein L
MATDRSFKDSADLQGLMGDAILDLFILDLLPADPTATLPNRYVYFCNWSQTDGASVQFAGVSYVALPVAMSGFEIRSEGVPPNPAMTVGNIGLDWTGLINTWNDLVGCTITRRRVLRRHLDDGTNPDPLAHWPDEQWSIEQKSSENKLAVTFQLGTAFDLDGVVLPRRIALKYTCIWKYKSADCGYTGPLPTCGLTLGDCYNHFQYDPRGIPFGGFPGLTLE